MKFARVLLYMVSIASLVVMAAPAAPAFAAAGTVGVSPVSGPPGSIVAVTGSGFTPGTTYTVRFGAATLVTATADPSGAFAQPALTVPALPRAAYSITVTTAALDTSNSPTFSITPQLSIDIGTGRVGDTVRVSGTGFAASSSISINFDNVGVTSAASDPSGTFQNASMVVPATSPGRHNITANDGLAYSPTVTYTVVAKLTFSPNVQAVGSQITLFGSGFTINEPISFYIDNINVSSATVVADISGSFSNATLTVPPLAQGSHVLKAQDLSQNTATSNLYIQPSLKLTPQTGAPGASVQSAGSGFAANTPITITYNNSTVPTSPDTITTDANGSFAATFTVPSGSSGSYTVQASDGTNSTTAAFTIAAGASLNPASGPAGTSVSLKGSNFSAGQTVTVNYDGGPVATATVDSAGSFTAAFKVPAGKSGSHPVAATDGVNTATLAFTVTASAALNPSSGSVDSGVTVSGTGFGPSRPVAVNFDRVQAATGTTDASGGFSITFKVPNTPSGAHQVTVADNANNSATLTFTTQSGASLSPGSGLVDSGVTVKGVGFGASRPVTISFDKIQVATETADAAGSFSISFRVPSSAGGTHQIVVTDGTNTAALNFSVMPSLSINPAGGYVGSNVMLKGTGFAASKAITFKYDNTQLGQATTDASGAFAATFTAPASKGGNHQVSVTDGTSTVAADFAMDSAAPAATVLISPADAAKADALTSFSWNAVADPSGVTYTLQIATDSTFGTVVLDKGGLTVPAYTLAPTEKLATVSKDKPYYWRVKAIDGASNESPWSAPKTFYVGFTFPAWGTYVIFGVVAVFLFLVGFWLGKKRSY